MPQRITRKEKETLLKKQRYVLIREQTYEESICLISRDEIVPPLKENIFQIGELISVSVPNSYCGKGHIIAVFDRLAELLEEQDVNESEEEETHKPSQSGSARKTVKQTLIQHSKENIEPAQSPKQQEEPQSQKGLTFIEQPSGSSDIPKYIQVNSKKRKVSAADSQDKQKNDPIQNLYQNRIQFIQFYLIFYLRHH
ncbi:unnamed protein product [Didymodactylos carnosus]|uniref:Uncharacterized protein n=1 Tax=Didymodactylos carnosus TaxID=1234261 RepID=A0A8S2FS61_9BILA|nr:unnamed protein product [Didymodactylos carnosus]CAF4338398.1 unnamed protein product [Didymodactylos carnosus]